MLVNLLLLPNLLFDYLNNQKQEQIELPEDKIENIEEENEDKESADKETTGTQSTNKESTDNDSTDVENSEETGGKPQDVTTDKDSDDAEKNDNNSTQQPESGDNEEEVSREPIKLPGISLD